MLRAHLEDAAITIAKSRSHDEVGPAHVAYAIASYLRARPEAARYLERARAGLGPQGSSIEPPVVGDRARALLESVSSEEDALALLERLVEAGGETGPGDGRAEDVEVVLAELERLVGLDTVKTQVRSVIAVVRANQARAAAGHPTVTPGLHLVFTGAPGTGKTTVARLVARLYAACGALPGAKLTEVDRSDLVAGYVGQTAIRTAEVVARARPGVLFIDEAYALTPAHDTDFGAEAIATLVKAMEDHRDDLAVVVAGYEDEMARLLASNPGLRSRFKTVIHFPDYGVAELTRIFSGFVNEAGLTLESAALEKAEDVFRDVAGDEAFGNARFARSLFEQAYASMALRAAEDGALEMHELTTLRPEDLRHRSRPAEGRARRIGFRPGTEQDEAGPSSD